jgi:hypothetical protein
MTSLEMKNPGLADTKTGANIEVDADKNNMAKHPLQATRHMWPNLLVVLAAWLVRIEHRRMARNIPSGWDAALSLQFDRLTDIRERLAEYLGSEEGRR